MTVTVFVPTQMEIKGDDKLAEVQEILKIIDSEVNSWEMETQPRLNLNLVTNAEIVEDEVEEDEEDIIVVENGDMFEGTRRSFRDSFFDNADNYQITDWCKTNVWSLSINGKVFLK